MKRKLNTPLLLRIIPKVVPWVERVAPWLANRLFVYLFFTPIKYQPTEKEKKAEAFAERFSVKINGKNIQCYRWGDGSKIILVIHGWAERATQFRRFIKPLIKEGYQVVGFDGAAHGQSQGIRTNLDEFQNTVQIIVEKLGGVSAIIGHSFGGVASLYAVSKGLPVKTLINIASPTISEEIIKTFLRALNGSASTGEAFKRYVLKKSGKPFNEYSALQIIKHVPTDINLLLVHDEEDKEVTINHPMELLKCFPKGQLLQTKGLGHTRILKDNKVIHQIVTFIQNHSSV